MRFVYAKTPCFCNRSAETAAGKSTMVVWRRRRAGVVPHPTTA
jgi:hypothetical protein